MNNQNIEEYVWRAVRVREGFRTYEEQFIRTDDTGTLKKLLKRSTETTLSVSVGTFAKPQWESTYLAPLYFKIHRNDFTEARNSARAVLRYMRKNWGIPSSWVEIICEDNFTLTLVIPPVAFGGWPNQLMAEINYYLAHQLLDESFFEPYEGIVGIDLEVYDKHHCLPVPHSRDFTAVRKCYIITLTTKQLDMPAAKILKLAKNQAHKTHPVKPRRIHQAVKWFAQVYKLVEERRNSQEEKFRIMMEKRGGWEVPPCIRELEEYIPRDCRHAEACRIIAQFLAWIKASPKEISQRLICLGAHRNMEIRDIDKIVTYAMENPGFDGCQNGLLGDYCPEECCGCFNHIWEELRDKGKKRDV